MIRKFVYIIVIDHNYTITMHDPIITFIYDDLYKKKYVFQETFFPLLD